MADDPNPASDTKKNASEPPDLEALSGLDFGPSWAEGHPKRQSSGDRSRSNKEGGGQHRGGQKARDRRSPKATGSGGGKSADRRGQGGPRSKRAGADRPAAPTPFQPTVEINLYPQDEAFDALVKRLRATARTYQLFEIAQLILEKPERFVLVVANKPDREGKRVPLYYSVPGHLPFESREAALNHVLKEHLDLFFELETVEVEPPKGNFQMVNRCGVTGELLGPPNYHRYQEFLQRHYANRIHGMPFDRFQAKVETVKEQETIDAWIESMKTGVRYVIKDRREDEPEALDSPEAARQFLSRSRAEAVVGSGDSVRFAGRDMGRLPDGDIRRSVEAYVEQQRKFPLDTANNIRGRLRRHKFTVYKKGAKGVSYVCAVKRKFRDASTVFTDSIQKLMEFIERNPEIPASKLPKAFMGIDTEKQRPEKLKVTEAEVAAAAAAKAAQDGEGHEVGEAEPAVAPESGACETAPASAEVSPAATLTEEEQAALKALMADLRWLITEGYVTEYGDGRLFAPPPMPEPKKSRESSKEVRKSGEDGSSDTSSKPVPEADAAAGGEADPEKPDG